ncbi:MAG: EF-hand domain-containing protein [Bdellovibrionaceae bacterium]|nr:EF-hand domain-containing protein [Pseudobdellovibrionaceae bacterium]
MKTIFLALILLTVVGCQSSRGKHHNHSHMKKMWMEMDTNKDEAVSKEEFDAAHKDMFKKMDANSDGKITKEEKMEFMKSKMEKAGCKGMSKCMFRDKASCGSCKHKCDSADGKGCKHKCESGSCKLDKK